MAAARLHSIAATDDSGSRDELFQIIRHRSFRRGHFKLASGIETDLYFNLKATIMDPRGGALVAQAFLDRAREARAELVGGLALGAVPTLGALAAMSHLQGYPIRTFFVRQAAKEHGTKERVEGLAPDESLDGRRVMVVDDVATKGGSIMQAIDAARAGGAVIRSALVIVDRQKGAAEHLREHGVHLSSLFRESDFT
jgi:orotate phosphoribosyltransferase